MVFSNVILIIYFGARYAAIDAHTSVNGSINCNRNIDLKQAHENLF